VRQQTGTSPVRLLANRQPSMKAAGGSRAVGAPPKTQHSASPAAKCTGSARVVAVPSSASAAAASSGGAPSPRHRCPAAVAARAATCPARGPGSCLDTDETPCPCCARRRAGGSTKRHACGGAQVDMCARQRCCAQQLPRTQQLRSRHPMYVHWVHMGVPPSTPELLNKRNEQPARLGLLVGHEARRAGHGAQARGAARLVRRRRRARTRLAPAAPSVSMAVGASLAAAPPLALGPAAASAALAGASGASPPPAFLSGRGGAPSGSGSGARRPACPSAAAPATASVASLLRSAAHRAAAAAARLSGGAAGRPAMHMQSQPHAYTQVSIKHQAVFSNITCCGLSLRQGQLAAVHAHDCELLPPAKFSHTIAHAPGFQLTPNLPNRQCLIADTHADNCLCTTLAICLEGPKGPATHQPRTAPARIRRLPGCRPRPRTAPGACACARPRRRLARRPAARKYRRAPPAARPLRRRRAPPRRCRPAAPPARALPPRQRAGSNRMHGRHQWARL